MYLKLEDVFITEGLPQYTFVYPPNYNEILVDIRKPGKPCVIEGQSGTGKTTTAKKIIEQLSSSQSFEYLTARKSDHASRIAEVACSKRKGAFIIDDFHRLDNETQKRLADLAKVAAEEGEGTSLPKLIIIGINKVGANLIDLVPDIAKRCGIHKIQPGSRQIILDLIRNGAAKLKLNIKDSEQIYLESKGDYWLTQHLCRSVCLLSNVTEEQPALREIAYDIASLRSSVVSRLESAYHHPVIEFCRGKRFRPSNDPYFKLLRKISSQDNSIVDLNSLATDVAVRGSINNIKEERLTVLLDTKPAISRYFYYNAQTKNFAVEDPALFYYIKHLDWERLRIECGFKGEEIDYEFDVAISFAGENRELARFISAQLSDLDIHVFFDEYYESNYLGKTWSEQFQRIFGRDSRLVVCLLDKNHKEKIWPTFERECFDQRVKEGAVIPIFLDDTVFPGISKDVVGIIFKTNVSDPKWKEDADDKIIMRLIDRI